MVAGLIAFSTSIIFLAIGIIYTMSQISDAVALLTANVAALKTSVDAAVASIQGFQANGVTPAELTGLADAAQGVATATSALTATVAATTQA